LERPLDQGKHAAFLLVEVGATGIQDGPEPQAGLGEILDLFHVLQEPIEFLMVVVETGKLISLLQDVIQSDVGQIGFRRAVVVEEGFQKAAEQRDLVHGVYGGQYAFHLIEQAQKDTVLGDQPIDDRHHRQTVVHETGKSNPAGQLSSGRWVQPPARCTARWFSEGKRRSQKLFVGEPSAPVRVQQFDQAAMDQIGDHEAGFAIVTGDC
jgi:hypothetical protein